MMHQEAEEQNRVKKIEALHKVIEKMQSPLMELTKSSGSIVEESIDWSSDEGKNMSRSSISYADRTDSKERCLRRRRRAKDPSKVDFEESSSYRRKIKSSSESEPEESRHKVESLSESDYEESIPRKIKSSSESSSGERRLPESDSEARLYFSDTEWNLQSDGEGTGQRSRSNQGRIAKTMWDENVIRRAPLYRAALMGQWEVAETIFNQDSSVITSKITLLNETSLHVAVGTDDNSDFLEKLVNLMCERSLSLTQVDLCGNTALAVAAIVGNVKAAQILVWKNETLPSIKNKVNYSPLHLAAKYGHRDMILYLLSVTKDEWVFIGKAGARLLNLLITFDIYDVALDILNRQPKLAVEQDQYGVTALQMLAQKPDVFESGSQLGFWKRLLHPCWCAVVEVLDSPLPLRHGDVENPPEVSKNAVTAPFIKDVRNTKRMHLGARKLVRRLCEEALNVGEKNVPAYFQLQYFQLQEWVLLKLQQRFSGFIPIRFGFAIGVNAIFSN